MKTCLLALSLLATTTALADYRPGDVHEHGAGTIKADSFRGIVNLSIDGDAARLIYNAMVDAKEETRGSGSGLITRRMSPNMQCAFSPEGRSTYHCSVNVDGQGRVNAGTMLFTQ